MADTKVEVLHKITDIKVKISQLEEKIFLNIYTDEQLQFTLLVLEHLLISSKYLLNNTLKEGESV